MHLHDLTEAAPVLALEEIKIVQTGMKNHASACTENYRYLICFRRALLPVNHLIFWAAEGVLAPEWLPVVAHTGLCSW